MSGGWRVGYGYQSAAFPAMKAMTAAAEVATRIQSGRCMCVALSEVRGPEPKPRASMWGTAAWAQTTTETYYVVQDQTTKKCTVTEKKPETTTITVVGGAVYKTKTEAEGAIKTITVCTTTK